MARVFVSYRRADGLSWVGWITERLEQVVGADGVQAAFHDGQLRAGDDFAAALDEEISDCDLVIAMIGAHWVGSSANGRPRIQDEGDWIVRELSRSFEQDKRVLPVLIDGQDPPLASELPDCIRDVAGLHAVPFSNRGDLDQIERHVRSHLDEIDRERVRLAGLDRPVELPTFPRPGFTALLALLTALALALLGLAAVRLAEDEYSEASSWWLLGVIGPVQLAVAGACGVWGVGLDRWISRVARFRRQPIILLAVLLTAMIPLALLNFAEVDQQGPVFAFGIAVIVVFLLPVCVAVGGVVMTTPRAGRDDLAGRARYVRVLVRSKRFALSLLSLMSTVGVISAIVIVEVLDELTLASFSWLRLGSLAAFVSGVQLAVHLWTDAKLAPLRAGLEQDLASVPQRFRANAALPESDGRLRSAFIVALPLLVGLPLAVAAGWS